MLWLCLNERKSWKLRICIDNVCNYTVPFVSREPLLSGILWKKCNIKDPEFTTVSLTDFILTARLTGVEKCPRIQWKPVDKTFPSTRGWWLPFIRWEKERETLLSLFTAFSNLIDRFNSLFILLMPNNTPIA